MNNLKKVTINHLDICVEDEITIYSLLKMLKIPIYSFFDDENYIAENDLCFVELVSKSIFVNPKHYYVEDGMVISTNSLRFKRQFKFRLSKLVLAFPNILDSKGSILSLSKKHHIDTSLRYPNIHHKWQVNIENNISTCIGCEVCKYVCAKYGSNVLKISSLDGRYKVDEYGCIGCKQCINACPTNSIRMYELINNIEINLNKPNILKLAVVDNKIFNRYSYNEVFNKLKLLGFNDIVSSRIGEEIKVIESIEELLQRIGLNLDKEDVSLPLIVFDNVLVYHYIVNKYPRLTSHLSKIKSSLEITDSLSTIELINNYNRNTYILTVTDDITNLSTISDYRYHDTITFDSLLNYFNNYEKEIAYAPIITNYIYINDQDHHSLSSKAYISTLLDIYNLLEKNSNSIADEQREIILKVGKRPIKIYIVDSIQDFEQQIDQLDKYDLVIISKHGNETGSILNNNNLNALYKKYLKEPGNMKHLYNRN